MDELSSEILRRQRRRHHGDHIGRIACVNDSGVVEGVEERAGFVCDQNVGRKRLRQQRVILIGLQDADHLVGRPLIHQLTFRHQREKMNEIGRRGAQRRANRPRVGAHVAQ